MKNLISLYRIVFILSVYIFLVFTSSCQKEVQTIDTNPNGVWQRYGSPKGYNTDLAVGNIPGEPSNRVYMCEHPGSPSAGLYKGFINGNIITWDAIHGLPNAEFKPIGNEMTLYFNVGQLKDAGKYKKGVWTNTCGELGTTSNGGGTANNMNLNGRWICEGTGFQISGTSATFYCFGGNWLTAYNKGIVNTSSLKLKNISKNNSINSWNCQDLFMTITNNVIEGTAWSSDGKINMRSDGTSITITATGPVSGTLQSKKYLRVN